MAEEKLFTKEAVTSAIRLAVRTITRSIDREDALKTLDSLPETLAVIVMEETVKAVMLQKAIKINEIFARLSEDKED